MLKQITEENFQTEVIETSKLVIVDFFATWCAPCKMLLPILEELQNENADKLSIVKVDTDESKEITRTYGVRGMPTLIFFKDGEVVDKISGVQPKAVLAEKIAMWA